MTETLKDKFGLTTDVGTDVKAGVWAMAGVLGPVVAGMQEGWPKWTLFVVFCATMVAINYLTRGSEASLGYGGATPDVPDEDDENPELVEDLSSVVQTGRKFIGMPLASIEVKLPVGISQKGIDLIKEFEGFRSKAYKCPAGVWTIGYGHTVGVKPGMTITKEQGEAMLRKDLKIYEKHVADSLGNAPTSQGQWDALVSFCYNAGPGNLKKSSMLRLHKQGKFKAAAQAFMAWTKGGGRVLPGLVRRRNAEKALYLS